MDIISKLNWRYATKRMTGETVPQDIIERVLETIRLSPSSYGLQPYEILIISNAELKEKISSIAYHQPQVKESSHLIVFAAWSNVTTDRVDQYIRLTAKERSVDESVLSDFTKVLHTNIVSRSAESNFQWAAKQTYIALGLAMVAAAEYHIDAAPLEGFDSEKLDSELGLHQKGLRSTVLLALGYRDTTHDSYLRLKKVRKSSGELFTYIQ